MMKNLDIFSECSKQCGCKGCRSCLLCEDKFVNTDVFTANSSNQNKIFYYSVQLQSCLCRLDVGDSTTDKYLSLKFPGVDIIDNFLSEIEEFELVNCIDCSLWKDSQSGRRKQDYGPKVNFKKQKVKFATFNGLPSYILTSVQRMKKLNILNSFDVVEQCNLEYDPERGSQIEPHFDDEWLWGERLVTLNLLSDTWLSMTTNNDSVCKLCDLDSSEVEGMEKNLRDILKQETSIKIDELPNITTSKITVRIPLKRRSLVILHGPARYEWKHAIKREDITSRRVCCTFRELSNRFLKDGAHYEMGLKLLTLASSFQGDVVL